MCISAKQAANSVNGNVLPVSSRYHSPADFEGRFLASLETSRRYEFDSRPLFTRSDLLYIASNWQRLSTTFKKHYESIVSIPSHYKKFISPGSNFEIYYITEGDSTVLNSSSSTIQVHDYTIETDTHRNWVRVNGDSVAVNRNEREIIINGNDTLTFDSAASVSTGIGRRIGVDSEKIIIVYRLDTLFIHHESSKIVAKWYNDAVKRDDSYHYSRLNWRELLQGANGIPDYVDETGFALDSTYAMEIERFGFQEPFPYTDQNHTSDRYKLVITSQPASTYGQTYPIGRPPNSKTGFISLIELRNNWSGWTQNYVNYDRHPHAAAHITCAHEYFHAIQYGLFENDFTLDNFPITWIEATAVSMEELAFDSVNDYFQYSSLYFSSPDEPLFDNTYNGYTEYKNGLLALFLYHHTASKPGIDFIRTVHYNRRKENIDFYDNLATTAADYGTRWQLLLGQFHLQSYFTGSRARSNIFLPDAALFDQWEISPPDEFPPETLTVRPFAMNHYSLPINRRDSLPLFLSCTHSPGSYTESEIWAAHGVLRSPPAPSSDSTFEITLAANGTAAHTIYPGAKHTKLLVIITNAHPSKYGEAIVSTDSSDIQRYQPFVLYPNPVRLSRGIVSDGHIAIEGSGIEEVHIYSSGGSLVAHADTETKSARGIRVSKNGFIWQLANNYGFHIQPGTYIAVAGFRDRITDTVSRKKRKIFVLP
jgi:hypothetical protein